MKDNISYTIILFISKLFSLLPFRVIYILSDIVSFLLYRFLRYRRKMVRKNLINSFPEKALKEIVKIEKGFYKYFCDYFLETLTLTYLKPEILQKKIIYTNPEVLNSYFDQKRSIVLVAAHYGNWEMTSQMPHFLKHRILAAYKPQSNKGFDRFFVRLRQRFGIEAVPIADIGRRVFTYSKEGISTITYLASDQRPMRINARYWTKFMNQEAPIIHGPEKIAVKMNSPVFYLDIRRVRRDNYEVTFELIEENPKLTAEFEITEKLTRHLENLLNADPIPYFWAHNRWKHRP